MDLIERYIVEVGRHLPPRSDVPDELRSLLSDTLEQRAAAAGRAPDDLLAMQVLREFGEPEAVAGRYASPRYLIGPDLYPLFESIATGIIAVSLGIRLIVTAFRLLVDRQVPQLASFPAAAWDFVSTTFILLALLTLVFFTLERMLPPPAAEAGWDPRDLPPLPGRALPGDIRRGAETSLWGPTIGLVLLNLFPQWLGIPFGEQYRWGIATPPELAIPLPAALLNLYWVAALVLNVILWRAGEWTRGLRWFQLFVGITGMAVVVTMLAGAAPAASANYVGLARVARGVLWGILTYQLWTAGRRLHALVRPASPAG